MGHAAGHAFRLPSGDEGLTVTPRSVLLLAAALAAAAPASPAAAQTWRTLTSARQLHGEREMRIEVQYGVGRFRLTPGAAGQLYRMEMRYDEERFAPVREFDAEGGILRLGVRGRDGVRVSLGEYRDGEPPSMDLALTPEIPLSLTLELGAVESSVELGGLALQRLTYRTGASETHLRFGRPNPVACELLTLEAGAAQFEASRLANSNCARLRFSGGVGDVTLDFSGTWRRSMDAEVTVGLGSLNLRLPRDLGVEIRLTRFLASFDAPGFQKRGDTYYSENWAGARAAAPYRASHRR